MPTWCTTPVPLSSDTYLSLSTRKASAQCAGWGGLGEMWESGGGVEVGEWEEGGGGGVGRGWRWESGRGVEVGGGRRRRAGVQQLFRKGANHLW